RLGEDVHGRERSEDPLAAAVDAAGAGAAGDVGDAVPLGHDALRLDEVGAVAAEDGVDFLLRHELLDELRALGGVRRVVEERQLDLHRLAADLHAPGVVDLLDGELGGLLIGSPDLRLLPRDRQDGADLDRVLPPRGPGQRRGGEGSGKQRNRGLLRDHGFPPPKAAPPKRRETPQGITLTATNTTSLATVTRTAPRRRRGPRPAP